MSDQQVGKESAEKELLDSLPPPGMISHWCQEQNQLLKVDFEWTIPQFSLLKIFENWGSHSSSSFFFRRVVKNGH